jgi:hypothetical protein
MTDPKRWLADRRFADSIEARVLAAEGELEPPAELVEQSFSKFAALVGLATTAPDPTLFADGAATAGQNAGLSAATSAGTATVGASVLKALGLGALLGTLTVTAAHTVGGEGPAASSPRAANPALPAARRMERGTEPRESPALNAPALSLETPAGAASATRPTAKESERGRAERLRRQGALAADSLGLSGGLSRLGASQSSSVATSASSVAFPDEPPAVPSLAASSTSVTERSGALKAEAVELARAKNLLEQGRAADALALLRAGSTRFAKGALADERELLTVQALSNLGRRDDARKRARSFLAGHGEGSISLRMQRLLERL